MKFIDNLFAKKTRSQVMSEKTEQIINDILISGFNNDEISIIIDTISKEGKSVLENRKFNLEEELISTNNAINRL